ncbi:cytochrome c oxidase subunit II [Thermaurantiacus sp.]
MEALARRTAAVWAPLTALPARASEATYTPLAPVPGVGQPVPGGIDLQPQVTSIGQDGLWMVHWLLNPVMFGISLFVFGLLTWTILRYRAAANPVPSKTTHNFRLEVIWTLIPALILFVIAVPSFRLLANQHDPPKADVTIKVTGYQWYWGYEYPDYGGVSFDAVMLSEAEAKARGAPYQLETDNRVVVPAGKTVKLLVTAADVLHSWALPAFWVKMDAVPGRINETWFKVDKPGVYYGQCSELCGTKHGFMPIAVEVVPEAQFLAWMRAKQAEQGIEPTGPGIPAPVPAAPPSADTVLTPDASTLPAPETIS